MVLEGLQSDGSVLRREAERPSNQMAAIMAMSSIDVWTTFKQCGTAGLYGVNWQRVAMSRRMDKMRGREFVQLYGSDGRFCLRIDLHCPKV